MVIGSNRCYLPEIIRDGENGFLCEYGDYDAWGDLTLELLSNAERRAVVSAAALESMQAHRIEQVAPQYLEIFQKAIG